MKPLKIPLLIVAWCVALVFSSGARAEGGTVGNGGGFARCPDQNLYAYDFLMSSAEASGPDRAGMSLAEHLQFISFHLHRLQEPLVGEFDTYASSMYTQIPGNPYQWFQRSKLPLMWEPAIEAALPDGCKSRVQAVYYFPPDSNVPYASYSYDPNVVATVQSQTEGELQVSYLWVHEWLWNYFSRSNFLELAQFNRLLHSEWLGTISPEEYARLRAGGR